MVGIEQFGLVRLRRGGRIILSMPPKPSVPARASLAKDVLVFRWDDGSFHLLGGTGRGASWAGIVEFGQADSSYMDKVWRSGAPVRVSSEHGNPKRICGPYWAEQAVLVPVGHQHLVVFGNPDDTRVSDVAFVTAAAHAVEQAGDTPADKLLADELELAHAVQALTTYTPTNVRDTARHVATVAARALSCDVAAVRVRDARQPTLEFVHRAGADTMLSDSSHGGRDATPFLDEAAGSVDSIVEQTVGPDPEVWTDVVVSRMTLPIGSAAGFGAISLGHAAGPERGFTSLCQRIGRALAESAAPLLAQAIDREQLTAERAEFQRVSNTDQLTGVGTRAAWESALT